MPPVPKPTPDSPAADTVRVRFAPSPTGILHLGNLRTALFNWLFARGSGGVFILRIEDTDQKREVSGALDRLMADLRWLGLDWDEGPDVGGPCAPYVQSERLDRYRAGAEQLLAAGAAYYCDCSPERLEEVRAAQTARGEIPRYDGRCRDRGLGPGPGRVIRCRLPDEGQTVVPDIVHGTSVFANPQLSDPVLMKSDGFPTYHLASVIDDTAMGITHVLRADEWLSSLPLHLRLYQAFGWPAPVFAHLPLIVDHDGRKLKKRPEDIPNVSAAYLAYARLFRLEELRARGYLPDAIRNYLALLGWNPGTEQEIFTTDELAAAFSLDRVSASPSKFDVDRLNWFNRQHIGRLGSDELLTAARPFLTAVYDDPRLAADARPADKVWAQGLVDVVRAEITTLADVPGHITWTFQDPPYPEPEALDALTGPTAVPVLTALCDTLPTSLSPVDAPVGMTWANATLRSLLKRFREAEGWNGQQVLFPIRAALTGTVHGPHLASLVALLDAPTIRRRVERALRQAADG